MSHPQTNELNEPAEVPAYQRPNETVTLYIDIEGGCLRGIYGDDLELPPHIQLDFVLRDHDNIEKGDEDPLPDDYKPAIHYW